MRRSLLVPLLLASACGSKASDRETHPIQVSPPQHAAVPDAAPPAQHATGCVGPPPGPGYECVRDCGEPVHQAGDPEPGWSWLSAKLAENRKKYGCPICLPDDAGIATPDGDVPVSELQPGMLVYSTTDDGVRVTRRVLEVVSAAAPAGHELTMIELADGRRLRASPGHPDADGNAIDRLRVGDVLDGVKVTRSERIPYRGRTFDLVLEDGAVYYFVDGVRIRSSL